MNAPGDSPNARAASRPIRILIADDHAVVRSGLRSLLLAAPDLEVVGEAADGFEAIELAGKLDPHLILLDITMPHQNGIQTAQKLKEKYPEITVVFLTMHEDEGLLHEALRTGASGYVIKRAEESEILDAIHTAMRGDIYVYPSMTEAKLQQPMYSAQRPGTPASGQLDGHEMEILRLLAEGQTNQRIAAGLGLSLREVETQRGEIMRKLGLASRLDLMNYAEEHHLC